MKPLCPIRGARYRGTYFAGEVCALIDGDFVTLTAHGNRCAEATYTAAYDGNIE